jgi:hypothetical protein
VYSLVDVMEYMVETKHDGDKEAYAASIVKYRKYRIAHIKRQITFAARRSGNEEEEETPGQSLQERKELIMSMHHSILEEIRAIEREEEGVSSSSRVF